MEVNTKMRQRVYGEIKMCKNKFRISNENGQNCTIVERTLEIEAREESVPPSNDSYQSHNIYIYIIHT